MQYHILGYLALIVSAFSLVFTFISIYRHNRFLQKKQQEICKLKAELNHLKADIWLKDIHIRHQDKIIHKLITDSVNNKKKDQDTKKSGSLSALDVLSLVTIGGICLLALCDD